MIDRVRAQELLGETIREMGILVVVFVPVDAFFQSEPIAPWTLAGVVTGAIFHCAWDSG